MKKIFTAAFLLITMCVTVSLAAPIGGIYKSTDLGGTLLTGHASTWRSGINSGLPHVLHAQSWDGTTLGTQWEIRCADETSPFTVQNNLDGSGTGTIVYTSHFTGGQLEFYSGGWPWGSGVVNLGSTTLVTTVQLVNGTPVASVVNGNTSGVFVGGCSLVFAIGNGFGVGETTSANLGITKPSTYPDFLDGTCATASPSAQFGTWGDVITITMDISCVTPTKTSTWGALKTIYR